MVINETPDRRPPEGGWQMENILLNENLTHKETVSQQRNVDVKTAIKESVEQRVTDELPDPKPLPKELPAVEPFDYSLLPPSLKPWVQDICERIQCPPDYVAVAVMVALGAVIGRKVGIRPQEKTPWTETPNMWGLIIGRPGVLKSPAMEAALGPLKHLEAQAMGKYQEELKIYTQVQREAELRQGAIKKAAANRLGQDTNASLSDLLSQDQNPTPVLRRYKTNDSSAEALGELLRLNPNGIMVFRDELVSLLKSLDRDEKAEARGFYLTGWNGDSPYVFDRIGRGLNLYIPAVCLSLLGSTQPGKISHYVKSALNGTSGDDGMLQRFSFTVWPDPCETWKDVDRYPDCDAKKTAFEVFAKLDEMVPASIGAEQDKDYNGNPDGIHFLRFARDALGLFREWRENLEARLRNGEMHPAIESHLAKYRKLVPSIALILHLANGGIGAVSRIATLQALAWAEYLESHAGRLYASVTSPEVTAASTILKKIKTGALISPFPAWEVRRAGWSGLTDKDTVKDALQLLVDYGWLQVSQKYTGGRTSEVYEVNPKGVTA